MEDPFLLDQNSMEQKLSELGHQFQRWRQLRDSELREVEDEEEFVWIANELHQSLKSIGWDLDDLEETLKLMADGQQQHEPSGPQLTRLAFIANSRRMLVELQREMQMQQQQQQQPLAREEAEGGEGQLSDVELHGSEAKAGQGGVPLLTWQREREDSEASSFPSVELDDLRDLRLRRFHNSDWLIVFRRYRIRICLYSFVVALVVAVVVTVTVATAAADRSATTVAPATTHWWNGIG